MKIFFDVDTQNDFMNVDGALYVPGAEEIKDNLELLIDFANLSGIQVIGSVDRHFGTPEYKSREEELQRYGGPFPDHCMDGTLGQLKIHQTIDGSPYDGEDLGIYIPHDLVKGSNNKLLGIARDSLFSIFYKFRCLGLKNSVYFEKQSCDIFTNPAIEELLSNKGLKDDKIVPMIDEAVVYGVATDYCVKAAVLGMQKRGIQCYVVKDAIKGVAPDTTKLALEEMAEAGAKFVTTDDVLDNI